MLKLEVGRLGLQKEIIKVALHHVIRNGKRWGRYEMDLQKDIKRLQTLVRRSRRDWQLALEGSNPLATPVTPASISGWSGQEKGDLVAFYGNDILETIALLEYWGLWSVAGEFFQTLPAPIK
jgi:hypothetical protein